MVNFGVTLFYIGISFMSEVKNFVLGFTLSVLGFTIYNQDARVITKPQNQPNSKVCINLFKEEKTPQNISLSQSIKKQTILSTSEPLKVENIDTTIHIADNSQINGIEDDEIINVNIEDIIPIEISTNSISNTAIFSNSETEEKVASLPSSLIDEQDTSSPWTTAQTKRNSKILAPSFANKEDTPSYKVAEKIKQSIIFPIPNEILSDENLTPTFIKQDQPKKTQTTKTTQEKPQIVQKKPVETQKPKTKETSFLGNITSWFSDTSKDNNTTQKTKKTPPVYSSQQQDTTTNQTATQPTTQTTKNLGDFYEALQNTKKDHIRNNIVPTELKLSFNKGRAEISGQTLRWLKAFSEKAINDNYYLQVRLDGSAPADLQKKRLNLLYTIFTNNGVNIDNVDTAFSSVEPNTFIIRTIKANKTSF